MISRFFIDRPIFATVLSVVITLIGAIALWFLPVAQYPRITPPAVIVTISYPGASAQVVADTVGAPIEQQVTGVDGMLYMSSQSGNDGSYTLTVTFDIGTDAKAALVKVQNRVALAMPQLPTEVQNQGITIRKKTPDMLLIVNLYSPDGRYDDIYLSNYAMINVRDELLRVDGVSDINYQGERDYSIRCWLDPQKLSSRNMTAIDVAKAIQNQNLDAPAGQVGQPPIQRGQSIQMPVTTLGRLVKPEQFAEIIVKVSQPRFPPQPTGGTSASSTTSTTSSAMMTSMSSSGSSGTSSMSSGSTSMSSGSTSTTSSTTTGGVTTSGGASTGGVTTTGGASTGGGATGTTTTTTSSSTTSSSDTSMSMSSLLAPSSVSAGTSALSITGTNTSAIVTGATLGRGTPTPSVSVVRMRDIVTGNRYHVRIRLDAARLAASKITVADVIRALKEITQRDVAIGKDEHGVRGLGSKKTTVPTAGAPSSLPPLEAVFGGSSPPADEYLASIRVGPRAGNEPTFSKYLGELVLADGGFQYLPQKAELGIELGAQNYNQACTYDGHQAVGLMVYQLPGTNALEVADRVRAKMEDLKSRFPDGVAYEIGYDTTPYIRESVSDVFTTLLQAVALVGMVVLVFLQDWKAMILPMIDVPVSIIGTCAVMAMVGFSLNNISLFGLVLAIGIVVDDAIVVLENVERLIATGLDARTATIKAMEEVTGPIIAVALVLCAVFVPCAFISGITGQFFRQFAVTISVSTVISAINAVTMTPSRAVLIFKTEEGMQGHLHRKEALPWWSFAMVGGIMGAWYGAHPAEVTPALAAFVGGRLYVPLTIGSILGLLIGGAIGWHCIRPVNAVLAWLFRGFNRGFDVLTAAYGWTIGKALRVSLGVLVVYGGLLFLTWWVFQKAPTGFIPQQDQGKLIVNIQLPDSASLERTKATAAAVERVAHETKGVAHTVTSSGVSFLLQGTSPNFASMFVVLDSFDKRQDPELRDTAIMKKLRKAWAEQVKDAQVTVFASSPIPGLGVAGGYKFIVEDQGGLGLPALQKQTEKVVGVLQKEPGLTGNTTQFRSNTPQLFLDIDRAKVASLGVSLNDVNQTLEMYVGSLYVNSYNQFGRHWQVTVQAEGRFRNRDENLALMEVRNNSGQMVPLGTLVKLRPIGGPIAVQRYNLYQAAAVNGNIQTGVSTGDAIAHIDQIASQSLPISMKTDWTELMFLQKRAGNSGMYVFFLAVIFVFLALAALYESWGLPLAVILVVPLCLLCSAAGVLYTGRDVNIFVQIGLVVLVGLACKNAILIVEYAHQLHREGRSVFEATCVASRLRLRPILMTSFAFIFGVFPLVIASGAGAEMRRSLGNAVFYGMLGVTLFGIFLTPVFFYIIQGLEETRLFASVAVQRTATGLVGLVIGFAVGFLLGKLGVLLIYVAAPVGAVAGLIVFMTGLEVHRMMRPKNIRGGEVNGVNGEW